MLHNNTNVVRHSQLLINLSLGILITGGGLSGCSAPSSANTAPKNSVTKIQSTVEQVVRNKQPAQHKKIAAKKIPGKKDKHHIEYERKRLQYNQQWLSQQEAKRQQLKKKYHDQYQAQQQQYQTQQNQKNYVSVRQQRPVRTQQQPLQPSSGVNFAKYLSRAAINRTRHRIRYDGRYIPISYPMGDVPPNIGVCTDVVIRSYRSLGIDFQRLIHEDMSRAFYAYPNLPKWGLSAPDPNIDHRRVHNMRAFLNRYAQRLPITRNSRDYRPGDIVTWSLGGDQGHVGIVVNRRSQVDPTRYLIVHNISSGTKMEDVLFNWPITGHFRYFPNQQPRLASTK